MARVPTNAEYFPQAHAIGPPASKMTIKIMYVVNACQALNMQLLLLLHVHH